MKPKLRPRIGSLELTQEQLDWLGSDRTTPYPGEPGMLEFYLFSLWRQPRSPIFYHPV
jgi:hypothetical protein